MNTCSALTVCLAALLVSAQSHAAVPDAEQSYLPRHFGGCQSVTHVAVRTHAAPPPIVYGDWQWAYVCAGPPNATRNLTAGRRSYVPANLEPEDVQVDITVPLASRPIARLADGALFFQVRRVDRAGRQTVQRSSSVAALGSDALVMPSIRLADVVVGERIDVTVGSASPLDEAGIRFVFTGAAFPSNFTVCRAMPYPSTQEWPNMRFFEPVDRRTSASPIRQHLFHGQLCRSWRRGPTPSPAQVVVANVQPNTVLKMDLQVTSVFGSHARFSQTTVEQQHSNSMWSLTLEAVTAHGVDALSRGVYYTNSTRVEQVFFRVTLGPPARHIPLPYGLNTFWVMYTVTATAVPG